MAKRFGGFTPQQQQTLLSKMGYTGPAQQDDINKFMMSSPQASSMMGKYAQMAKARVSGGPRMAMNAGGLSQEEQMKMFNQQQQQSLQGTAGQPDMNPAAQMATQVTPEQMAAQQQAQTQANAAQQQNSQAQAEGLMQGPKPTEQQLAMRAADDAFTQSPVMMAAQEADKALQKQAMQQAGLSGPPTNQEEAERFRAAITPLMENSPEIQAARKAQEEQNAKMQQQYGQGNAAATSTTTEADLGMGQPITKPLLDLTSEDWRMPMPGQPALPVEPEYDPTAGLPEIPVDPITEEKLKEYTSGIPSWANKVKDLFSSGEIPEDTTDWKVTGGKRNYTLEFKDGTKIPLTGLVRYDTEQPVIQGIVDNLEKIKAERSVYNEQKSIYDKQLEQYKSYYGQQSTVAPEQTRANLDTAQSNLSKEQNLLQQYATQLANMGADDPQRDVIQGLIDEQQIKVTNAKAGLSQAQTNLERLGMPSTTEMRATALEDPASMVTKAGVVTTTDEQRAAGKIAEGTGQAATTAEQATVTTADIAPDVVAPVAKDAATYDATTVTDESKAALDKAVAARGDLSKEALMEAAQGNLSEGAFADAVKFDQDKLRLVDEGAELSVTKEQLAEAKGRDYTAIKAEIAQSDGIAQAVAEQHQVQPEELPDVAQIRSDEMAQAEAITADGLSTDAIAVAAKLEKFSVDDGTLALAMEGEVNALSTVEGQLSQLMKDFDDGTPAWAAGAIRAANAAMSARGIGASSMAGTAVLQAAMESALPIAQQDANTFAQMGLTNLNNRQQVSIANAAAQQGLSLANLNNEQQAALQNSANAFALQSQNLSNMQQTVIANAQIKASLQGQNLSNQQQTNLAVAARFAEAANQNLNNKQQTVLQNNTSALQVNLANLDKKSQAYVTNAQLAASLQGQVLTNEQQVAISNAARYASAANIEFTAQQQAALHNSTLMQTVGLAELDAEMSAVLQNAAQVAQMDITNLNNRQQAAVQNAKAFLERDMTNLNNEQQMAMFKAQATQQALLSDQAAENAAKQFNAASENQTNQFYDNLTTQVAMQNQEQTNAMNRFNAGEENAIEQFNAAQQNARDQFNASSALVVEQANAQWEQAITTMDNAAQNAANRDAAVVANNLTETTYNNMLQQERDAMDYAWRSADTIMQLESNYMIAEMQTQANVDMKAGEGTGKLTEKVLEFVLGKF